jgi:hypothetical protein
LSIIHIKYYSPLYCILAIYLLIGYSLIIDRHNQSLIIKTMITIIVDRLLVSIGYFNLFELLLTHYVVYYSPLNNIIDNFYIVFSFTTKAIKIHHQCIVQ